MTKSQLPISVDVEVKADISDSVNEIAKNTLDKPTKSIGNIGETILSFVHNFFLYPMQKYNIYAESKLEKYESDLKSRIDDINPEEIVESSVNIIGPTIENLKYNLDEEHIKNMFTNILISDMTKSMKNKVQPSFIEIIKQLSNKDAKFIQTIRELQRVNISTLIIKDTNIQTNGYTIINYVLIPSPNRTITPDLITLDNLQRLGLIKIEPGKFIVGEEEMCKNTFNYVKNHYRASENSEISYDIGILEVTSLGRNFVEVCTR